MLGERGGDIRRDSGRSPSSLGISKAAFVQTSTDGGSTGFSSARICIVNACAAVQNR